MTAHWGDMLPSHEAIRKMSPEKLKDISYASSNYLSVIGHGISGIGNLLACTASNSEAGLSANAVTDIGWMLESLGLLISNLSDTGTAAENRLNEIKQEA